jgi:hypothetical protein
MVLAIGSMARKARKPPKYNLWGKFKNIGISFFVDLN